MISVKISRGEHLKYWQISTYWPSLKGWIHLLLRPCSSTSTALMLPHITGFPRNTNSCLLFLSRKQRVAVCYSCPLHLCWFNNFPVDCQHSALMQSRQPFLCTPRALWQVPSWQSTLSTQDGKSKLQLGLKGMGNLPGPWGFDRLLLQCPLTVGLIQFISQAWIYCGPLPQLCDEGGGKGIFIRAVNTCSSFFSWLWIR